jgi:hypothetical protein
LLTRFLAFGLVALALCGCGGGGGGVANSLVWVRPGSTWVFQYTGTVKLPASQGGGTQNVTADSTLTYTVSSTTSKDLNNADVNILERKFDLTLLDGRQIKANFRQYFTQTERGIFVHGYNNYVGTALDPANDKFVPSTVTPQYSFLYMPSPVSGNVSYTNPFALTGGDNSYSFAITNTKRLPVQVPAGQFNAMTGTITEKYDDFVIGPAGLVPEVVGGVVSGTLKVTFPDGTELSGTIFLKSANP